MVYLSAKWKRFTSNPRLLDGSGEGRGWSSIVTKGSIGLQLPDPGNLRYSSCGEGTWENWPTLLRQLAQSIQQCPHFRQGPGSGRGMEQVLSSGSYHHNPDGVVRATLSSLETLLSPLGASISVYHGKLSSLNTLNAILSISLKSLRATIYWVYLILNKPCF